MDALTYFSKYKAIYEARDTRKRFIPLEKIANDPVKYGYSELLQKLPKDYKSNCKQNDFIKDKSKIVCAICANRGGKSESACIKLIELMESIKKDRGGSVWVLTESFDLQKSGIQTKVNEYFKPERILQDSISYVSKKTYKSFIYRNKHGIDIPVEFKTYEQGAAKLQAAKLYAALFDEEPPEDVFEEVRTRTIDLEGQVIMAFTPLKGHTWSYDRLFNSPSKRISIYNWGMTDNPFIPRQEIEDMKSELSPRKYNMRCLGMYQGSDNMIYESFDRNVHLIDYNAELRDPVYVSIDWGVVIVSILFFQKRKVTVDGKTQEHYFLFNAIELEGAGYSQVMRYCLSQGYYIPNDGWFCDPAGSARSQATRTGKSLLKQIELEYGVKFRYIKKLGVEESIDMVDSFFMNANAQPRLFIKKGLKLNDKGDTPEQRIEGYVRDSKTNIPIKDGINDHFCDALRYFIANQVVKDQRGLWIQK